MTKQEEIREGIRNRLCDRCERGSGCCDLRDKGCGDEEEFISYLASQGVVIKVEQQLADIGIVYYNENVAKMLKAGYEAVESLIEKCTELPFTIDTNKAISKMTKEEQDWVDRNVVKL